MTDTVNGILHFILENGVPLGAAAALLFYLMETYFNFGRTEQRTALSQFRSVIFLLTAAGTIGFAYYTFISQYDKKSVAKTTSENIRSAYARCITNTNDLTEKERSEIEGAGPDNAPIALQCLAYAVGTHGLVSSPMGAAEDLRQDIELGAELVRDQQSVPSPIPTNYKPPNAGTAIKLYFGVYKDTFLGTGFTIPGQSSGSKRRYSDAKLREFLAPNYCVEPVRFNLPQCKVRYAGAWAWTLDKNVPETTKVRDIVLALDERPPNGSSDVYEEYLKYRRTASGGSQDLKLIRLQKFPITDYRGTVGRPEAKYAIFSNEQEVLDLTLSEALTLTGRTGRSKDKDKSHSIFIWVLQPETSEFRLPATWQNLFELIRSTPVDGRIKQRLELPQ